VTLIAWGAMMDVLKRTAEIAHSEGKSLELIDLRTLCPLDRETILASVRKTGRAVIVHEAPRTCGLGAELAALIAEHALLNLDAPVLRVTGPDITVPLAKSEEKYYPQPNQVMQAVERVLRF